jgi:hypothetical protein
MDRFAAPHYRLGMARRSVFDPLEISKDPRRYTVRFMHGALLEARPLPAGSDLKHAFVAAMLAWIDAGVADKGIWLDRRLGLLHKGS